ncbi:MAG: GNAT family N-acetyltransferase [Saprospiraceae bacterium]|nr:GNAT family N-acetyltransferase [Saprospiraceae bacterium]
MIAIKSFSGKAALAYIHDLATLRIEVFREFPYLYDGHMAAEQEYLQAFLSSPDAVLVLAFDGEQVIGASTGLPMAHETPNIQQPFVKEGYDVNRVFYYGESVLRKSYRGKGVGLAFFEHREAHARSLKQFDWVCFCGVIRPENHPRRPADFVQIYRYPAGTRYRLRRKVYIADWKQ